MVERNRKNGGNALSVLGSDSGNYRTSETTGSRHGFNISLIPAPPPLSEPAIVNTIGVFVRIEPSTECCETEALGVKSFEIELCVIVAPTILQDVGERTPIEGEVALGS